MSDAWTLATSLLVDHHWLPVRQRIWYKLAMLAFMVRSTFIPEYLSSLLPVPRSAGYSLCSADHPLLSALRTRTSTAGQRFFCTVSLVWNSWFFCKLWHILWLCGCSGLVLECRSRKWEVAGSTHAWSTASNLEQVADLLCAQANSTSYPQRDGKWVVATGWRPSVGRWCVC